MSTRLLLPILVAAAFGAWPAAPPDPLLKGPVTVAGGQISGVPGDDPAITAFKGIPFAAPPTGPLRWRTPRPVIPWTGVRTADHLSPSCIQTIVSGKQPWTYEFMAHGEISEDCLYANVWTPARAASERRPVFVYIYGGANVEGSTAVPLYDGEGLARKGLVVVTFNYRVGVLGFFTHPALREEAEYHASGNYGLLDQIAAVRWVHDNIAAFGGDPARVTIAGQSAGASAVHSLTASPLAAGLFQRAIAESGSSLASAGRGGRTMAEQERDGVQLAEAKGAASLAALRAMPWQEVVAPVAAAANGAGRGQALRYGVVVDGYALPAPVQEIIAAGRQNDVATLTGSNADENGAVPHPTVTAEAFTEEARRRFGDRAGEYLALYPAATDEQARASANDSARDLARTSTYLWALKRAETAKTKVFTYFFTHPLPGPGLETFGAFHTSEVPYVLNTLNRSDRPFTDADRRIAATLSSYWANFATSGDPNGPGLPRWPAVDRTSATTMEVGDAFKPIPVAGSPEKLTFARRTLQPGS